ncbi:CLAVATA3/ESR (CLE)-related protein [Quillaja saponaria]|uniref:CLAVATA3/ESR (CLE)-related protein n=1 Tax=Quillaja saponaria TaxID=32244 RepID=A0AAD7LA90_QUISA|nr:CLAVATA3/ESR (CLE)-related protein [Quillaja saponaria]
MWTAGGRRLMCLSAVVLMIFLVLQTWVFCPSWQVEAIQIFPANTVASVKVRQANIVDKKSKKQDLFQKYFRGRSFFPNRTQIGFEDSQRRVPSSPDPIHN